MPNNDFRDELRRVEQAIEQLRNLLSHQKVMLTASDAIEEDFNDVAWEEAWQKPLPD